MTFFRSLYSLPRRSLIFVVELYRTWISPTRMPTCRFEPTCSGYAVEALTKHGFLWGSVLSVWRLLKCGPWHKPGYDPVPENGPLHAFHQRRRGVVIR
ncbi:MULTISPECIES: membrane protein insertion efficiency factor YidD [Gordonia]|jgi:putative membrane protein insertion efficiency factor|uniref:membrane protein insertion efficiency factor YidD n=2 Tax=Gordoniaceae TaxID=85026 RepID=UPI001963E261|nr:membrane protein insertion efficiency factor YidD [Gordonia sp. PDNC005]QRY62333.1 membrane protein insertion efficiency factor YidD [Gordonia sp. PDNC005]